MLTILSVAIGIILVLLLMSILTSTVHDIIANMLSLRARHLKKSLSGMLGETCDEFLQHPFFKQLTYADHNRKSNYALPDWVDKKTFSAVLHDVLQGKYSGANLADKIQNVQDPQLRSILEYLVRESDGTIGGLKAKMENWFDEVMERSSAYFSRATKWRLFFIGLILAACLNADTIQIYQTLAADPELREKVVQAAERIAATDTLPQVTRDSSLRNVLGSTQHFLSTQLDALDSPLGLGWNSTQTQQTLPGWLVKLAGFLLTGIAVTFGAPFWFDLLKKLLSLRNAVGGGADDSARRNSPPPPGNPKDQESIGNPV